MVKYRLCLILCGIKYTGTGYSGSLLAMDKSLTKKLLINTDIPTAEAINFNVNSSNIARVSSEIGFPCVVKPCSCGSSAGVSIANNEIELQEAINLAGKYENEFIIEKYIKGREFSVGVLEGKYLPPIEIIPKMGFYDYKNKYQAGLTTEICPADLSVEETRILGNLALKVHSTLRLRSYSRMDFIYDGKEFFCLEANTLPGMTPTSLVPQEAKAAGISYEDLCNKIIELALN